MTREKTFSISLQLVEFVLLDNSIDTIFIFRGYEVRNNLDDVLSSAKKFVENLEEYIEGINNE